MKTSPFSICSNCIHSKSCVLTNQKEKVWSCSEYDESFSEYNAENDKAPIQLKSKEQKQEFDLAV